MKIPEIIQDNKPTFKAVLRPPRPIFEIVIGGCAITERNVPCAIAYGNGTFRKA